MKKLLLVAIAALVLTGSAQANVFHYACKGQGSHYAIVVDTSRHVVKMQDHGPSGKLTTFHILSDDPDTCGKGGWSLSDNATFCYYTQGEGL